MTSLSELADRIEAAEGPDRTLDAEIWKVAQNRDWRWQHTRFEGPAFTASLDAAMTLVPEGWAFTIVTQPPDHKPWASVREWRWSEERERYETGNHMAASGEVKAATPALALCAAAFRARSQEN